MPVAQCRDANGRPRFAVFGAAPHLVESDGQFPVRPVPAKLAQNLSGSEFPAGRERASLEPRQPDFGVEPTDPVQQQNKFVLLLVDVDHDLFDQQHDHPPRPDLRAS